MPKLYTRNNRSGSRGRGEGTSESDTKEKIWISLLFPFVAPPFLRLPKSRQLWIIHVLLWVSRSPRGALARHCLSGDLEWKSIDCQSSPEGCPMCPGNAECETDNLCPRQLALIYTIMTRSMNGVGNSLRKSLNSLFRSCQWFPVRQHTHTHTYVCTQNSGPVSFGKIPDRWRNTNAFTTSGLCKIFARKSIRSSLRDVASVSVQKIIKTKYQFLRKPRNDPKATRKYPVMCICVKFECMYFSVYDWDNLT